MAGRKKKILGKRKNEIKSKQFNGVSCVDEELKRKRNPEKDSIAKWLSEDDAKSNSDVEDPPFTKWLGDVVYKQISNLVSECNSKLSQAAPPVEEIYCDKLGARASSEESDECGTCKKTFGNFSDDNKTGILKRKASSMDSIVNKYIKTGIDQVASFIVESALKFGKEHGVVVPDKGNKNTYQISSPYGDVLDEKKIRFQIPDQVFGYEDAKKAMWRHDGTAHADEDLPCSSGYDPCMSDVKDDKSFSSMMKAESSGSESFDQILPVVRRMKNEGPNIDTGLDIHHFTRYIKPDRARKYRLHPVPSRTQRAKSYFHPRTRIRHKRCKSYVSRDESSSSTKLTEEMLYPKRTRLRTKQTCCSTDRLRDAQRRKSGVRRYSDSDSDY